MSAMPATPSPTGEPQTWDLEAVYDNQIAPHVREITRVCEEHGLPYMASFEYAPGKLCTSALVTDGAGRTLNNMWAAFERSFRPTMAAPTIDTTRNDEHR